MYEDLFAHIHNHMHIRFSIVLLPCDGQDLVEAKTNISKRLEYIEAEMCVCVRVSVRVCECECVSVTV